MATIGRVDKYILELNDVNDNKIETTLSKRFAFNSEATYQQVDTASRAIAGLSTYTYNDTILVTNISVNEVLAG